MSDELQQAIVEVLGQCDGAASKEMCRRQAAALVAPAGPVGKLQARMDALIEANLRLIAQRDQLADPERIRREAIGASDDLQTAGGLNAVFDVMATDSHRRSELWFPRVHSELDRLLAHLAMGVAGEAGEACDEVKKVLRDAKYDFTKVGQELADALTYIVMLGQLIGLDWELAIDHMIVKCENRWGALAAGESAVTGEAT